MAWIQKPENNSKKRRNNTAARAFRQKFYNTTEWRKCRENHLRKEPLCRRCAEEGRLYGGSPEDPIQVHHIKSPFNLINMTCDMGLFLSDDNLETICSYHHGMENENEKEKALKKLINELEDLFNGTEDEE